MEVWLREFLTFARGRSIVVSFTLRQPYRGETSKVIDFSFTLTQGCPNYGKTRALSGWRRHLNRRVQLKCDGTRWRTGGEVKGKLANGVGSPVLFTLPRNMVYPALLTLMRTPRLPVVDWTDAPADLNRLVLFAERRNAVYNTYHVPQSFLLHCKKSMCAMAYLPFFLWCNSQSGLGRLIVEVSRSCTCRHTHTHTHTQ